MVIYESSIKATLNEPPKDRTDALTHVLPDNIAVDGAIGGVAVHESTHNTQENMWQNHENAKARKNKEPEPHNLEKDPTEMQNQYLEELLMEHY